MFNYDERVKGPHAQAAVKELLKRHGMDLSIVSCCIVNQSCLAMDARDPHQLLATLEKLIGSWGTKLKIDTITSELTEKADSLAALEERAAELSLTRVELQPEVAKLLKYYEENSRLEREKVALLRRFESGLKSAARGLRKDVRFQIIAVSILLFFLPYTELWHHAMQRSEYI
jgi:hypothetical protein